MRDQMWYQMRCAHATEKLNTLQSMDDESLESCVLLGIIKCQRNNIKRRLIELCVSVKANNLNFGRSPPCWVAPPSNS